MSDTITKAFNRSGATQAREHFIYSRLLTEFDILVFFTNLILMEFEVRYLAIFLLFSVLDGVEYFWKGSLHKNILSILEFLKAPFLVLHFSHYTLMTFLMMLSVRLLSMLIRAYTRHWTGPRSGLLISVLGKLNWFCLMALITLVLLM